jgi:hypothetical protein
MKKEEIKISETNFIMQLSKLLKNKIVYDKTKYINKHIYISNLIYLTCLKIK